MVLNDPGLHKCPSVLGMNGMNWQCGYQMNLEYLEKETCK